MAYKALPKNPVWYGHPELIPEADLADALERFAHPDEAVANSRMKHYRDWRSGWAWQVRLWGPQFMMDHDDAVELAISLISCTHAWERGKPWSAVNPILNTGSKGYVKVCTKCGQEERVTTWKNNYSGD